MLWDKQGSSMPPHGIHHHPRRPHTTNGLRDYHRTEPHKVMDNAGDNIRKRHGFIYLASPLCATISKCPDPALALVENSTKPDETENTFGQPEERPLAEHYYKHGAAKSTITMMQRRKRQPRMMSARHKITNFKSPYCFANANNNFEVLQPSEAQAFLVARENSFHGHDTHPCHEDEEQVRPSTVSEFMRSHTFPLLGRSVRFREEKFYVFFDENGETDQAILSSARPHLPYIYNSPPV